MSDAVSIAGLHHAFGDLTVLDGVDLDIAAGETTAIVGPSGCGKSTLLRILAGLVTPTSGQVVIDGRTVTGRTGHAAYMPQADGLLPWRRALANATLAAEITGDDRAQARRRAQDLFARFGLAGFERSWPAELSGGMRQRVAFLRTILTGQGVLLLDEPFGALDAMTRADLHDWLGDLLHAEPRTALLVTHDIDDALRLADTIVVLSPRPGRPVLTVPVPGSRPRDALRLTDPDMAETKRRVLTAMSAQSAKSPAAAECGENSRRDD